MAYTMKIAVTNAKQIQQYVEKLSAEYRVRGEDMNPRAQWAANDLVEVLEEIARKRIRQRQKG